MARLRRGLWLLTLGTGIAWCLATAILWWSQEAYVFPGARPSEVDLDRLAAAQDAVVHHPVAADGTRLMAWHHRGDGDRLLLFFHGNGSGLGASGWFAAHLPGWDVVTFS